MRGRVTEPGEFLELSADGLRSLVAKDAELSEIFMRAFILRRLELVNRGQGNVILMGSRHSANTLRLREFLTRNEHPFTYVDLDTDKTSQELLDRFEVKLERNSRGRFATPGSSCAILPCRNWPIAWDSTARSMNRRSAI